MHRLTLFVVTLICIGFSNLVQGQIGREFWFVAPAVIEAHGDAPVAFRITAMDKPTTVTLTQPANPSFTRTVNLDAYQQKKIEFDQRWEINTLENFPSNTVNDKGILITSDEDITAYYEVVRSNNPDKFTLKGENALGLNFFISGQNSFGNEGYNETGWNDAYRDDPPLERADIVATEDNTVIEITPSVDILGHNKDITYSITLDRGETYCIQGISRQKSYTIGGSHVKSNKPIAITISDDSVNENDGPHDLIGDQTIPTSMLGTEYIAMFSGRNRTWGGRAPVNKVYVMSASDNNYVNVDFDQSTSATYLLNSGDQIELDIYEGSALHIDSDNPIYVYQQSGLVNGTGNELGSAILPPIKCTGSSSVAFTKILNAAFYVQILTQYKNISSFTFTDENGNPSNLLNNLSWKRVPGTGNANDDETWYFVNKELVGIETGEPHTLSNSNGLFHLSVFDENSGSASFGYYSAFNTLHIDGPEQECNGKFIRLNASESLGSYNWFSDLTGSTVLSTQPYIDVDESGTYWVKTTRMVNATEGCELVDSIDVEFTFPEFTLGGDVTVCNNEEYVVVPDVNTGSFEWYDGSSDKTYEYTTTTDGTKEVWLEITDNDGCVGRDTIEITTLPPVDIDINLDVTVNNNVCYGHIIKNQTSLDSYEWRYGSKSSTIISTDSYIEVFNSGWYYLTATKDGCASTDSAQVTIHPLPTIQLDDELLCHDDTYTSPINSTSYNYLWTTIKSGVSSNTAQIIFNQTDSVYVLATDPANGCQTKDSAYIEFREETLIPDINVNSCAYTNVQLVADATINPPYSWSYNGNPLSETSNQLNFINIHPSLAGQYIISGLDGDGCNVKQTINLVITKGAPIDLGADIEICEKDSAVLSLGSTPIVSYQWFFNQNPEYNPTATVVSNLNNYKVGDQGKYYIKTKHSNGCFSIDSLELTINPLPNINLPTIGAECYGNTEQYDAGAGFAKYLWHDGSTAQTFIADRPQDVSVTITDINGCANADTVNYDWLPINIFADEEVEVCPEVDNTLTVSNALNNISWYFDDGSSRVNLNNHTNSHTITNTSASDAGDYIVRANENGCTVEDTISLSVITLNALDLGSDQAVCSGETLNLEANHGFDRYEWRLESDPTIVLNTRSITAGNESGVNNEVWIANAYADDKGCVLEDTITLKKLPLPLFELKDNITPCANDELNMSDLLSTLDPNSNINDPQVKYYWSNNLTTPIDINDIKVDKTGNYIINVSNRNEDSNGNVFECFSQDNIQVDYHNEFQVPHLNDQFICDRDATTLVVPLAVENLSDLQSYQWVRLNPDNSVAESNAINTDWIDASIEGTYALNVLYSASNCLATGSMDLIVKELPSINITGDSEACRGDHAVLSATKGLPQYTWSNGTQKDSIHVNSAGNYDVTVTGTNGCQNTASFNVSINELPVINLANPGIQCRNASHIFNAGAGFINYEWHDGSTNQTYQADTPQEVSVTVTDVNGCVNSANADYEWKPVNIFPDDEVVVCPTIDYELKISNSLSNISWYFDDGSTRTNLGNNTASHTVFNVGSGDVGKYIVRANEGGCLVEDTISLYVIELSSINLGPDRSVCNGEAIELNANLGFDRYEWKLASDPTKIVATTTSIKAGQEIPGSSETWILDVYEDDNGCSLQDEVIIEKFDLPKFDLIDNITPCSYDTLKVEDLIVAANSEPQSNLIKYYWRDDLTTPITLENMTIEESGKHFIVISKSQTDNKGNVVECFSQDSVDVNYHNEFVVPQLSDEFICKEGSVDLLTPASIKSHSEIRSYKWSRLNPDNSIAEDHILDSNWLNVSTEGKHMLTATFTNDNCIASDTLDLIIKPAPSLSITGDQDICRGDYTVLSTASNYSSYSWSTGSLKDTIHVNNSGKYKVTVIGTNGCQNIDSVNVTVNELPAINLTNPGVECYAETEFFDAGAGLTSYLWHDGSTTQTYLADHPQKVSVTITDINGCVNADTVDYEWQPVTIFADEEVEVCPQVNYTLNVSNALTNISWHFYNGTTRKNLNNNTTSHTITNLSSSDIGDYIVRAIENGCMVEDTISLSVIALNTLDLGPDQTVCNGEEVILNADRGFDRYEWRLDPNNTILFNSRSITAGYENSVTEESWIVNAYADDKGCVLRDTITIEKLPVPLFSLKDIVTPCPVEILGMSNILNSLNSNSNIDAPDQVKYYWENDLTTPIDVNDIFIEESGTYTISVSNRNNNSKGQTFECFSEDNVQVNYHSELIIPQMSDQFICENEATTLQAPAGLLSSLDRSYQWMRLDADNNVAETNSVNTDWVGASTPGNYMLNVNYTADACTTTDTITLISKEIPDIKIYGNNEVCRGNNTILSATSGYAGYLWNTGQTTDTIYADTAGKHKVTVTGHNGCINSDSVDISVNELPIVTPNNSTIEKCENSSTQIDIISINYPDGSTVANPIFNWNTWETSSSINVASSGNYNVEVNDNNGCTGIANVVVNNYPKTTIDLSGINNTACYDDGVHLVCPLIVGSDISSFQWVMKNGDAANNPAPNTNWNVKESGTYLLTVIDNNMCHNSDSIEVTILSNPNIDLGADVNKCIGDSIFIKSPEQYASYQWNNGSTSTSVIIPPSSTPINYGITVWDDNGCSSTDDINVTSISLPTVTINTPPPACGGQEVELVPRITAPSGNYSVWWDCNSDEERVHVGQGNYSIEVKDEVSGCVGTATTQVTWRPTPKVTLGGDQNICPTITDYPIHPEEGDVFSNYLWHNNATDYEINSDINSINSIMVTDANGCKGLDQIIVQHMSTESSVYEINLCQQDTTISLTELDPESSNHTGEYLWSHDGSTTESNIFSYSDTVAVDIGITLDGTTTCYYKRDSLIFDFMPLPEIERLDTIIYQQIRVDVDLVNIPYQYSLDSINWQDENVFTDLGSGTYSIYVIDNNQCVKSETVSISGDYDVNVPPFFTPNDDGYNDTWEIEGIDRFPEAKIRIFDRYGKLIALYPATSPGWNGYYMNKPMPTDDYWYVVELKPINKLLKGHFTLKR